MIFNKNDEDLNAAYNFFEENYQKYGYAKESLSWGKGKQNERFYQLTKNFNLCNNMSLCDVGCGFGDINLYLKKLGLSGYKYLGVDLFDGFIEEGKKIYHNQNNIFFETGDFLGMTFVEQYDYVIESGVFNFRLKNKNNYDNVRDFVKKALGICKIGISFDFLSDKVDYIANDIVYYYSPEKILSIAYEFSRNVILDNTCMPFEFTLTIFKDDKIEIERTIFKKFLNDHRKEYIENIFLAGNK